MSLFISIITAVYNDEKYIRKSVESILNQTFDNFEYIVVNDGSTDNTLKILEEVAKSDQRLIILTQKNAGAAAARNLGINLAKGKYIAIQDSDDVSAPDRIQKQVDQLLKSDENLISCTGYNVIDENGNIITSNNKIYTDINKNILKGKFGACHPSMMFPKHLMTKAGGYNTFYSKTEDYDLILKLLENNACIEKLNECLYNYRIRENSEGTMNNGAFAKRVYENHLNRIKGKPENFSEVINDYKIDKNYFLKRRARDFFYSENYSAYIKLYLKEFYRLPINNYLLFFFFSISPRPLKKVIKSIAN